MRALAGFVVAMALALAASPDALAHGPESHGGEDGAPTATQAQSHGGPSVAEGATPTAQGIATTIAAAPQDAAEPDVFAFPALANLHPATVHFAIGLLLSAALVELVAWRRRSRRLAHAVNVMVGVGAIGSVVAVLFGWLHTGLWFGGGGTIQWHRWLGTNLAVVAAITWWAGRNPANRPVFRVLLFALAALIVVQSYLGGELAHGPNHLGL